jgi:tRNA threonylcarbamoyladenosine biosynthesis protein TsaB
MLILALRTDKPEAEIGLYNDNQQLAYFTWEAHRQLAETIHSKIKVLLEQNGKTWQDIAGVVAFKGPGSFTGLRIGLSVANALAYSLNIPVVAAAGEHWQTDGINRLKRGEHEAVALPEYGAPVHITQPKR